MFPGFSRSFEPFHALLPLSTSTVLIFLLVVMMVTKSCTSRILGHAATSCTFRLKKEKKKEEGAPSQHIRVAVYVKY